MSLIPVKVIPANLVAGAIFALEEALAGKCAVFISPREIQGEKVAVEGLPEFVEEGTALIVESSGSTGTPKRISISAEALIASAKATEEYFGAQGQWLLALPINYIAGIQVLVRSLLADTYPVQINPAVAFTPESFAMSSSLLTAESKFTSLVPTQLIRLQQLASHDPFLIKILKRYDAILVGGQATSAEILEFFSSNKINVVESYGMAETSGGCVYDQWLLNGVEVKLVEDNRVAIKGPMLANNVANSDGFLVTQDIGEFDSLGRLKILGRSDRVLISGGLKTSLDQVEAVAASVPGVLEVGATALSSAEWGERVGIVYVGSPEVADYIAGAVFEQLGIAAKPIRVIRVDRLPRLANGKTDLIGLKKLFSEETK
jgi:O-succinylbenzoic acid--CoA ligase